MPESTPLQTVRDFIRWAVSRFNEAKLYYGHGTDNAWDEAVTLVLQTLHLPFDIDPTMLDARVTPKESETLRQMILNRVQDYLPVPYLTREAYFAGLSFYVDQRVLIPRSPIAELIENQFQPWVDPDAVHDILDVCTGSGCIAIACAKYFPDAHVDACDISNEALQVAEINRLRHQVEKQVTLYQSDLLTQLPPMQYDIIVSNPPYVDAEDMADLPKEYHHEPALALAGGESGLDLVIKLMQQAIPFLKPDGILIVEVGNSEYALAEKYPNVPFTWLEFERGGGGVFLLTREQLIEYFSDSVKN